MKDLSGYIDTLLDGHPYNYQVSFDGETHIIDIHITDILLYDTYVEKAMKMEVSRLIDQYIPEGTIKYLVNINFDLNYYTIWTQTRV